MIKRALQHCRHWMTVLRGQGYYDDLYAVMHERNAFKGDTWRGHLEQLRALVPNLDQKTILDFGCGPKGGLAAEYGQRVISFDPYVAQFSASPWEKSFDVVFSSDVLEHMTQSQIRDFLRRIRTSEPEFVFLVASIRQAHKSLPNGVNAHLTVKPAIWWLKTISQALGDAYVPRMVNADLIQQDVTLCFERSVRAEAKSSSVVGEPQCAGM